MAYTLQSVDLTTYGIYEGHAPQSNVSLSGNFDMPARLAPTFHSWGDTDGIEAFTDSSEIFFAGRDISFHGWMYESNSATYTHLQSLRTAVDAASGTKTFATPYGTYSVILNSLNADHLKGSGTLVTMAFREPVATLTGGSLPGTASDAYQIDGRPFSSFGLYVMTKTEMTNIPELKAQQYTAYGYESFQPVKRQDGMLKLDCVMVAVSLADFQSKIRALYLQFSSSGSRQVKINNELYVTCFADRGFKISNTRYGSVLIARFRIDLRIISVSLSGF